MMAMIMRTMNSISVTIEVWFRPKLFRNVLQQTWSVTMLAAFRGLLPGASVQTRLKVRKVETMFAMSMKNTAGLSSGSPTR